MRKAIAVCGLTFFILLFPLYTNNTPYLDDYYLINEQQLLGFWGPTNYFQQIWGVYRIVYTFLMAPIFSAAEHTWALRLLGITLHFASATLIFAIIRRLFSPMAALTAFALFLFFPFALEAIAWPSNLGQYPLAPFLALLGAWIALKNGSTKWKVIAGGLLMAFSCWIHEQVGPIIFALAASIFIKVSRKNRTEFSAAVVLPVAANLLLIYLYRDSNIRLSGQDAASLGNIFGHASYVAQLIRTTPLGDLYYSPSGIQISWFSVLILVCALFGARSVVNGKSTPEEAGSNHLQGLEATTSSIVFSAVLMVGAYVVTLLPIILSPVPWHTARVVYIPFVAFALSVGVLTEALYRLVPRRASKYCQTLFAGLLVLIICWQAHALQSEAVAYDKQITINYVRAQGAASLVQPDRDLTESSLLVVGGFPGTDVSRPQFGEHIIGMTEGELKAALGLRVYSKSKTPRIHFSSGWDSLCKNEALDEIGLRPAAWDLVWESQRVDKTLVTFLVWANGRWNVQRPHGPKLVLGALPEDLPKCDSRRTERVG
jgi:hypothetical protein